jgi:hypothetical protein
MRPRDADASVEIGFTSTKARRADGRVSRAGEQHRHDHDPGQEVVAVLPGRTGDRAAEQVGEHQQAMAFRQDVRRGNVDDE